METAAGYTLITMNYARPFTGNLDVVALFLIRCGSPVTVTDHLVNGWDALGAAARGEKREANLGYAYARIQRLLSGALSMPKGWRGKAAKVEIDALHDAYMAASTVT